MSILAFWLILAAGLGWSGVDWSRKALAPHVRPMPMVVLLLAGQATLVAGFMAIAGPPAVAPGYWAPAAASVALNLVAQVMYARAVSLSPMSLAIPYLAFAPAFTTVAGAVVLAELPDGFDVAGLCLIVAGGLSLATAEGGGNGIKAALRALATEPGPWRVLVVAVLWSMAYPMDKLAIQASSPPFHGSLLSAGVVVGLVGVLAWRGRLGELAAARREARPLAVGVVAGAIAIVLQFLAMTWVPVNMVEAIKRVTTMTMAAVVGHWGFGERLTRRKGAAIALMALGVALMLL